MRIFCGARSAYPNARKGTGICKIGVNRASLGVQDTNPEVQKAVNRIQPPQRNKEAVSWLRESGINNINIDLMYGLPLQTIKTFEKTIEDALELEPARIALLDTPTCRG